MNLCRQRRVVTTEAGIHTAATSSTLLVQAQCIWTTTVLAIIALALHIAVSEDAFLWSTICSNIIATEALRSIFDAKILVARAPVSTLLHRHIIAEAGRIDGGLVLEGTWVAIRSAANIAPTLGSGQVGIVSCTLADDWWNVSVADRVWISRLWTARHWVAAR